MTMYNTHPVSRAKFSKMNLARMIHQCSRAIRCGDILFYRHLPDILLRDYANLLNMLPNERPYSSSAQKIRDYYNSKSKGNHRMSDKRFIDFLNFICEPILIVEILKDDDRTYIGCHRVKSPDCDVYRGNWDDEYREAVHYFNWNDGEWFLPIKGLIKSA